MLSDGRKSYRWTVEIEVSETWVEDGFNLTDDRANDIMLAALPFATSAEVRCRVISSPPALEIAKAQGYATVAGWKADHRD